MTGTELTSDFAYSASSTLNRYIADPDGSSHGTAE